MFPAVFLAINTFLAIEQKERLRMQSSRLMVLVAANVTYKDTLLGVILDKISRKINRYQQQREP